MSHVAGIFTQLWGDNTIDAPPPLNENSGGRVPTDPGGLTSVVRYALPYPIAAHLMSEVGEGTCVSV